MATPGAVGPGCSTPHIAQCDAPVIVGTGAAAWSHGAVWWKALLALLVALALVVGVNFANDYSDGIRGTDDDRAGPSWLVGAKLATPAGAHGGSGQPVDRRGSGSRVGRCERRG